MTILLAFCAAAIVGAAIYMLLSRNLVRMLLGFALLSTGVNLMLFIAGGPLNRKPPIIEAGRQTLGPAADPFSQALVLTAIVIGFALTLIMATIMLRAWRATASLDARDVDAPEQAEDPDVLGPVGD
ncbi:sodium:proton antiporter [Sphingomonas sp. S1-29]|uniref:sodium:proton antiporter n=1 Tax=Sphingomonas sp. S1-29 TaxID=2991074 RepID=UPI00223E9146|nr:sodium:proton antiporter [Sphingomonas sp. S1-29]UZK68831.1 sodium:proton antiporter [Sphingomonas sp. S1-29]